MPVVIMRHAHTDWNGPPKRFQGRADVGLSERGVAEAETLGRKIQVPNRVVSSPARRCRDTIDTLFGNRSLAVDVDPRLWEIDNGFFSGKLAAEVDAAEPQQWRIWCESPSRIRPGGGEFLADMLERVRDAVDGVMVHAKAGEDVLIMTHGGPIRVLLLATNGQSLDEFHDVSVGSLARYQLSGSGKQLLVCPQVETFESVSTKIGAS